MRLYLDDLSLEASLFNDVCQLACSNNNLDLCYVRTLPGMPLVNASHIFPMLWRFFPTLDPQVDLFVSRDLDSRFSERELAAVQEWIESGKAIHAMRDHPLHPFPLLGGAWGARLD